MLTEDVIPTPVGPYGESKIAAESYIKEHFILPTTSPYGYSFSSEEENVKYSDKRGVFFASFLGI